MRGTFQNGDSLSIIRLSVSDVQPGDVVVFRSGSETSFQKTVHRVFSKTKEGLVTRGDSAGSRDADVVTEDLLVGKVVQRDRNGRVSVVHGGWRGFVKGRVLNIFWDMRRMAVRRIQKPYLILKQSGFVRRVWKPRIARIRFDTEKGPLVQFVHGKRVVARFWEDQGRFECRKPWDLVLDEIC